jgi:hypothetical protein
MHKRIKDMTFGTVKILFSALFAFMFEMSVIEIFRIRLLCVNGNYMILSTKTNAKDKKQRKFANVYWGYTVSGTSNLFEVIAPAAGGHAGSM